MAFCTYCTPIQNVYHKHTILHEMLKIKDDINTALITHAHTAPISPPHPPPPTPNHRHHIHTQNKETKRTARVDCRKKDTLHKKAPKNKTKNKERKEQTNCEREEKEQEKDLWFLTPKINRLLYFMSRHKMNLRKKDKKKTFRS